MLSQLGRKVVLSASLLVAAAGPSYAYVVDGLLSDWGVTPFSSWAPSSPTADWAGGVGENGFGGPNNSVALSGFGGEFFDVEAFYFDDDEENLYFALLTSFPQGGVDHGGIHYRTGDIAISTGWDKNYEIGIKTSGSKFGKVYSNPTWTLPHGYMGWYENGPSEFSGGTLLGVSQLVYAKRDKKDDENESPYKKNLQTNYVIEGAVSKSLLPYMPEGYKLQLHYTMSCGNDDITIKSDIDHVDSPVPEPASMALFGMGLLGMGAMKRMKKAVVKI